VAAMLRLKLDTRGFAGKLDALARKQLPFAAAQALNAVGRAAITAEQAAMRSELDRPRSFTTQQGLRLKSATKGDLEATVTIPPIQSHYLAPEILGGSQVLYRNRAVLKPIDQATDQYGNLPRGLLARLKGRPDIFIGGVKTRAGIVEGVWQRVVGGNGNGAGARRSEFVRRRGGWARRNAGAGSMVHGLKLLVRFADPSPVRTRYAFGAATIATARAQFPAELRRQLIAALNG